ncbi:hypothetical protein EN780_01715 [Mesorhizobium sp. M4B.F.Ca.ET.089.01.1.1]|uniref:polysaccharide biosynthesis/export family protein n=1 Tax=Mesorhizobium sp. M4B.F.Ca.ET.089.01.1.1 TaxID=2496662 RepID=UPI000FE3843E|nr:polysaccharide biosynthesis/export family protein [Mesorhizobium sp. M4B.F.Ca.ET.089.01.1.1]RWX70973.1 hypothetical protein EN780_01715 [Mesorhizobium sp. M4B.F.Ca.ET.089.01.1.1]
MAKDDNSEPVSPLSPAAGRMGVKVILLVVGLSGVTVLGGGAVRHWEAIQVASGGVTQKVEDVSVALVQKAGAVSEALAQRVGDVSGALVQKASAAIDSWKDEPQDQPVQTTSEPSRAIVSGPDAPKATLVEGSVVPAVPTSAARPKAVSTAPDLPTGSLFSVGDRLKVVFYERVDVEEDKWGDGSSASALRGIVQRPELSGEYVVQEDGTISVPLLGSIPVANRSTRQVQADSAEIFGQLLGRKGLVDILPLERSPIYVLGPVKNPGSFKYAPGMTILHAIALAGGLDRGDSQPWQKIEAVRETQKRSGAIDQMSKLLARTAVLKAERDGTEPKIPRQLLELAGETEAANLVNEQSDRRKAIATARKERERTIRGALEAAKQDVTTYGHMESLDELVKLRQDRVNSMRTLVDRNVVSMTVMDQVRSELSDAEQRRQDALNQYAMAKQRLASLEAEALRTRADLANDLEVEIESTESQIATNLRELNSSEGVLYALPGSSAQLATDASSVTYQIVRQSASGPVSIKSVGMTLLQPGDLVNILVGEEELTVLGSSPTAASSPVAASASKDGGADRAVPALSSQE